MLPGPVTRSTGRALGPDAVGEHRDRLGAADGVDLVDAEQRARGQDRGVREPAEVLLRRDGSAMDPTPAAWAGTTFMITLDG